MSEKKACSLWDAKAKEWGDWVGDDGDENRRLNSDPILWELLGDVEGKDILDAGCGSGYLSFQMAQKGGNVVGIDWAPTMIEVAQARKEELRLTVDFRVDSCSQLDTIADSCVDRIVSNYVLMDLPDLDGASQAFYRVLRPGGKAIFVISHPCFGPPGGAQKHDDGSVSYRWPYSYFKEKEFTESWGPFQTPFVAYHRPLSQYWQSFRTAGFQIQELREPIVSVESAPDCPASKIQRYQMMPLSMAFLLVKPKSFPTKG